LLAGAARDGHRYRVLRPGDLRPTPVCFGPRFGQLEYDRDCVREGEYDVLRLLLPGPMLR